MHVAASRPEFLTPDDVPAEVVAKEREVQVGIAMNEGKSKKSQRKWLKAV